MTDSPGRLVRHLRLSAPALAGFLFAASAIAGTADLSWTNPATNTDGSVIPATGPDSLASTLVQWFQCASVTSTWPANPANASVPKPATTYQVQNLTSGQRYCFRVFAVNTAGNMSGPSGIGEKVIPGATPNPPVLTVSQTTAYRMRQAVDGYQMLALGTVPLGTACDTSHSVDGYNVVPRSKVTPTSQFDTLPLVVFAKCS